MMTTWIDVSLPSPSSNDTINFRDKCGNLIRKMQVRNVNDKIEHETVQKRFYVDVNEPVDEKWKIHDHALLQTKLLSKGKKNSHIKNIH